MDNVELCVFRKLHARALSMESRFCSLIYTLRIFWADAILTVDQRALLKPLPQKISVPYFLRHKVRNIINGPHSLTILVGHGSYFKAIRVIKFNHLEILTGPDNSETTVHRERSDFSDEEIQEHTV